MILFSQQNIIEFVTRPGTVLEVEEVRIGGLRMEASFTEFYADLKATEKKDSTLTPKQQIDRLLKPGSSYR